MPAWTWEEAEAAYRETEMPSAQIAELVGVTRNALFCRMNRRDIHRRHDGRGRKGIARDPRSYRPRDIGLSDHPRFRCQECAALCEGPSCPNGHLVNPYLVAGAA